MGSKTSGIEREGNGGRPAPAVRRLSKPARADPAIAVESSDGLQSDLGSVVRSGIEGVAVHHQTDTQTAVGVAEFQGIQLLSVSKCVPVPAALAGSPPRSPGLSKDSLVFRFSSETKLLFIATYIASRIYQNA